ncbi:6158_t:CDS:2, partial [Funneliformis caledonium]
QKERDDQVKLWREVNDRIYWTCKSCKPDKDEFRIIGYLRSDVTPLSAEDIQDINKAINLIKRASEVMANKYKISTRRVYQIWREAHPPIDPKDIKPLSEEPGSYQQVNP